MADDNGYSATLRNGGAIYRIPKEYENGGPIFEKAERNVKAAAERKAAERLGQMAKQELQELLAKHEVKGSWFSGTYSKYSKLAEKMCASERPPGYEFVQKTITAGSAAMGEDSTKALEAFTKKCTELLGEKMWVGGARQRRKTRRGRGRSHRRKTHRRR